MPTQNTEKEPSILEKLLKQVEEKHGLLAAYRMENSLKADKQQVQEFHDAGGSSEDFSKVIGVQLDPIMVKKSASEINGLNASPQVANPKSTQVSQPMIASKPASSPFGFGGMSQDTSGQLTEQQPGFLSGLLMALLTGNAKTPARIDMSKLLSAQELTGQGSNSIENEQRRLEVEIKKKQLQELNSPNGGVPQVDDMFKEMGVPPEQREDFQVKMTNQNIRGMVRQVPTLERKKTLPASEIKEYNLLANSHRMMKKNMEFLQEKGLRIGPGLSTRPGAVADILGQLRKGGDFNTWKASVGRAFDIYRKWITGAQASYKEINWIAPNYPKATDTPDIFIQKSLDVMKDIEANSNNLLNNFSEGGYAVSKMRKGLSFTGKQPSSESPENDEYDKYLQAIGGS